MKQDYSDLFDLLDKIEGILPKTWPSELPSENTPGFWETATRQEFEHRSTLTEKIRLALSGSLQSFATFSPIEVWLYQRRMEWATQIVLESVKRRVTCPDTPLQFLTNVIVDHWNDQGAIAFFDHAMMRDGKPHPDTDEDILSMMRS